MRCHISFALGVVCLCFSFIYDGTLTMGQSTPDSHGVRTYRPGTAEFDSAVAGLAYAGKTDKSFLPYGIIIQNGGTSSIVAYSLQWIFDNGDGVPIQKEQLPSQPFALNDGAISRSHRFPGDLILDPGDSRLITPVHNYLKPGTNPLPLTSNAFEDQQVLARYKGTEEQKPLKEVRLAAYVLADGTCVQFYESKLCDVVQAQNDAVQDVMQAAAAQSFNESLPDYLALVAKRLDGAPVANDRSAEYAVEYKITRNAWLDSLKGVLNSKGYAQTMLDVQRFLYKTRPTIVRETK